MNNKFKIDKSVYMMMGFVAVIGFIFIVFRSDLLLNYHYLSEKEEEELLLQNKNKLEELYKQTSFLLLVDDDQPKLAQTLEDSLERMGKKVKTSPITENFTTSTKYDGIIIATENIDDFPDIEALITYVESGGSVFFAIRPSPGVGLSALYQQVGMVEIGAFIETHGIELMEPFFASSNQQLFSSKEIRNSSLSLRVGKQSVLYAKSSNGTPLLWTTKYGEGKFVFFNGTMFADPSQIGLFVKGVQLMVPTYIYPVINAKVTALEGFPFPVQEGKHMNSSMTKENFVRHVIWGDLQRLEAKYDMNFTTSFVTSFDDTNKTLQRNEWSRLQENAVIYGRELLRMGGEFGVQGYNNLPIEGLDKSDVQSLMQATDELMESALPGYEIKSYIPVEQNEPLSHLKTIHEVFPNLEIVLASVDEATVQETGLAILPKHLKGFHTDSFSKWKAFNGLMKAGFITQSLSPQSLLNNNEVDTALQELASLQKQYGEDVPWLRNMTLSNTTKDVRNYVETTVFEEHTEEGITFHLNQLRPPAYFFFSSDKPVKSFENCTVTTIGPKLYLIETNELTFEIRLGG